MTEPEGRRDGAATGRDGPGRGRERGRGEAGNEAGNGPGRGLAVGSATVPGQAATQDAGMFVTSHAAGLPGQVAFSGFGAAERGRRAGRTLSFTPAGSFTPSAR